MSILRNKKSNKRQNQIDVRLGHFTTYPSELLRRFGYVFYRYICVRKLKF